MDYHITAGWESISYLNPQENVQKNILVIGERHVSKLDDDDEEGKFTKDQKIDILLSRKEYLFDQLQINAEIEQAKTIVLFEDTIDANDYIKNQEIFELSFSLLDLPKIISPSKYFKILSIEHRHKFLEYLVHNCVIFSDVTLELAKNKIFQTYFEILKKNRR